MKPLVVLRVDASDAVGHGHVVRCLALAQALRERGADCRFLAVEDPAFRRVEDAGFEVEHLPAPEPPRGLGATADALLRLTPDIVVVDSYAMSEAQRAGLGPLTRLLVQLDDDPGGGSRVADVILNGNAYGDAARYTGPALVLGGPRYALLRAAFAKARERIPRRGTVVTMGGVDLPGATIAAVQAVVTEPSARPVRVVLGARFRHRDRVASLAAQFPEAVELVNDPDPDSLADLFSSARVAVSAAGSTLLELAACGTPALTTALAENQVPVARAFSTAGGAIDLGRFETWDASRVRRELAGILADESRRNRMGRAMAALVDGEGAPRAAGALLQQADPGRLRLRAATLAESRQVWRWRNDPQTRAQSLTTDEIPWSTHEAWYAGALRDPLRRVLILEDASGSFGVLRFDLATARDEAEVNINLAPESRGRGLGTQSLTMGLRFAHAALGLARVTARVKGTNTPSLRAFQNAGFRRLREGDVTDWVHEA